MFRQLLDYPIIHFNGTDRVGSWKPPPCILTALVFISRYQSYLLNAQLSERGHLPVARGLGPGWSFEAGDLPCRYRLSAIRSPTMSCPIQKTFGLGEDISPGTFHPSSSVATEVSRVNDVGYSVETDENCALLSPCYCKRKHGQRKTHDELAAFIVDILLQGHLRQRLGKARTMNLSVTNVLRRSPDVLKGPRVERSSPAGSYQLPVCRWCAGVRERSH